jgi:hypothetical protein
VSLTPTKDLNLTVGIGDINLYTTSGEITIETYLDNITIDSAPSGCEPGLAGEVDIHGVSVKLSSYTGGIQLNSQTYLDDNTSLNLGTTTGSMIASNTSQKLGFWGVTPVVQQVLTTSAGATVDNVITFLQTIGLCKQS